MPLAPGKVDLHTHTRHSDGLDTPAELVAKCARQGVRRLAVTDHDTLAALPEACAAGEALGVEVFAGIELSVQHGDFSDVHLLGYFFDPRGRLPERLPGAPAGGAHPARPGNPAAGQRTARRARPAAAGGRLRAAARRRADASRIWRRPWWTRGVAGTTRKPFASSSCPATRPSPPCRSATASGWSRRPAVSVPWRTPASSATTPAFSTPCWRRRAPSASRGWRSTHRAQYPQRYPVFRSHRPAPRPGGHRRLRLPRPSQRRHAGRDRPGPPRARRGSGRAAAGRRQPRLAARWRDGTCLVAAAAVIDTPE